MPGQVGKYIAAALALGVGAFVWSKRVSAATGATPPPNAATPPPNAALTIRPLSFGQRHMSVGEVIAITPDVHLLPSFAWNESEMGVTEQVAGGAVRSSNQPVYWQLKKPGTVHVRWSVPAGDGMTEPREITILAT